MQHGEKAAQTGTIVGLESPQELQKMSIEQLNELASNIRSYIISVVSQNGGHLSSNLGVVELTIALHYCFDFSKDRLVFDVGHQSYVHKLLTGRAPQFPTLRTKGGISGFPKRSESEYDAFNVGHSSTAISAALGMLRAMRLKGDFESRALALILKNFQSSGENLKAVITSLVAFMRILTPSYYLAAAAAGGASSAVMFYQMLLLVILAVEKLLLALVLPMIHIYLLIALVNDLSGEEILSHMTELLETCVNGLLKSSLGVLVGMQMIRNLIAPALDSLRQMALWRTAGMIPGIGNAVNAVTELVAGSAVLIRNCFGVTAMLVLLAAGMVPAVQLLVSGLSFRLLAAAAQPVSDKRIAGCLAAAGKGYAMLLRLLLTVEVLFLLTIAILAGTFS